MNQRSQHRDPKHKASTVVCVLGMHRSGTSMVARLLNLCGVYLGPQSELLLEEKGNEAGHWEHLEVLRINDAILQLFGGDWLYPPSFPKNWLQREELEPLRSEARKLIEGMRQHSVWGFKDPRSCLTLPFWQQLLPEMLYVIPVRSAMDVAQSLRKRQNINLYQGIALWDQYWHAISEYTIASNRVFTVYQNYFSDWKTELDMVLRVIDNDGVGRTRREHEIAEFINPSLMHYSAAKNLPDLQSTVSALNTGQGNVEEFITNQLHEVLSEVSTSTEDALASVRALVRTSQDNFNERNLQVHHLVGEIEKKDQHIANLESAQVQQDAAIQEQQGALQSQQSAIETITAQVEKKDQHIAKLESTQVQQDAIIQEQQGALQSQQSAIETITAQVEKKDQHIAKLESTQVQQDAIIQEQRRRFARQKQLLLEAGEKLSAAQNELKAQQVETGQLRERVVALESSLAATQQEIQWMRSSSFWRLRERYMKFRSLRLAKFFELTHKAVRVLRRAGIRTTLRYLVVYLQHGREYFKHHAIQDAEIYREWIQKNESMPTKVATQMITAFTRQPMISVVTPVYNTDPHFLEQCIQSVLEQSYSNWQLLLHDDGSTHVETLELLKKVEKMDKRVQVSYSKKNQHISAATNHALHQANGEFVTFLDADDALAPHAFLHIAAAINENSDATLLYGDHDNIDEHSNRSHPFFKPDWNPDLLLSMMYIGHPLVCRTDLVQELGGMRIGYEGAQDYDLALRIVERLTPSQIVHIPKILYHWRKHAGSTAAGHSRKNYADDAGRAALNDALHRTEASAEAFVTATPGRYKIKRVIEGRPTVSILIPFRDQQPVLERCIKSIVAKTQYKHFEILLLNNQSSEPETLAYLHTIEKKEDRVRVFDYDHPFNFSAINNFGVTKAAGEYILFLNNDTEVITDGWLKQMLQLAQRPTTGAVGAKLLYPNNTVQHAGVVVGIQPIAGHAMKYFPAESEGYFSLLNVVRNYSAVTGACLMIRKELFEAIGGFNEKQLGVAYNDVDLCLRIAEKGYWNVYTPHAQLYHYESLSRGHDEERQQIDTTVKKRLSAERAYMTKKWGHIMKHDPAYNPNLTHVREDFTIALNE